MAQTSKESKIAFRPNFSVHILDERQLLLLSENRSFRLQGRLYVALAEYLEGAHSRADIEAAFAGRVSDEKLDEALTNLIDRHYVTTVSTDAPSARQALWAELEREPLAEENRLAARSVRIRNLLDPESGFGTVAATLETHLADLGLKVHGEADEEADLLIVVTDDYLRPEFAEINETARKQGQAWMPFKPGGIQPLIGPVFHPDAQPCWSCMARRMRENRPGDLLVFEEAVLRPARAGSTATHTIATGLAAWEISREIGADEAGSLHDSILSLDLNKLEFDRHTVLVDPFCAVCGTPYDMHESLATAMQPVVLDPTPLPGITDGGWRVATPEAAEARLTRHVSPLTGIIAGVIPSEMGSGLPVYYAWQTQAGHISPQQNRRVGQPGSAAGKGATDAQARVSCLAEAAERYCGGFTGNEPRRRATMAELGAAAIDPRELLHFSQHQYDTREEWNAESDDFHIVPDPFDESRSIEWTPAWSLTQDEVNWLPTRYCYYNYADSEYPTGEGDNFFCSANSNGCASGSTLEEALLQGFLELVERDACAMWWYNRLQRPAIDLHAIDDPFLRRAERYYKDQGRDLYVLDLTNDLGIPVYAAVSTREGGRILIALGAHLDGHIAASRAVSELNQMYVFDDPEQVLATSDLGRWLADETTDTQPFCLPDANAPASTLPEASASNLKDALEVCLDILKARDLNMLVLDQSRPEIDFSTVRVVVPGLRHFWRRLAPGRLYDVPVQLGWRETPCPEEDLHPMGFFL